VRGEPSPLSFVVASTPSTCRRCQQASPDALAHCRGLGAAATSVRSCGAASLWDSIAVQRPNWTAGVASGGESSRAKHCVRLCRRSEWDACRLRRCGANINMLNTRTAGWRAAGWRTTGGAHRGAHHVARAVRLDASQLLHLLLRRHVVVQETHAAHHRHRHRHLALRHCVRVHPPAPFKQIRAARRRWRRARGTRRVRA